MESLPVEVPRTALYDLTALFVPPETPTGTVVELVIVIEDERINVRELGAYLSLADRVYGRMTRAGLMSYAHRTYGQLEISEIRKNSIELNIKEVIVFSVFRLASGWKEPANILSGITTAASREGTIDTRDFDDLKTTPQGRNFVEHELPPKDTK
jgi:hypothetical protein